MVWISVVVANHVFASKRLASIDFAFTGSTSRSHQDGNNPWLRQEATTNIYLGLNACKICDVPKQPFCTLPWQRVPHLFSFFL